MPLPLPDLVGLVTSAMSANAFTCPATPLAIIPADDGRVAFAFDRHIGLQRFVSVVVPDEDPDTWVIVDHLDAAEAVSDALAIREEVVA